MVELRWAVKMPRNPRVGPHTVLQYRTMSAIKMVTDVNGIATGTYMDWGDWLDVPTERLFAASMPSKESK